MGRVSWRGRAAALLLILSSSSGLLPAPARADCEADIKVLLPQVQALSDSGTRRRAVRYMTRALRELDEGDELDCQPAADAVRAFLSKVPK